MKTLWINNIPWKLKWVNGANRNLYRSDGSLTLGMTDNRTNTIYINKNLRGKILYNVLCHELVHAFAESYDIYFDLDEEERLAQFISNYGNDIINYTDEILNRAIHNS